MAVYLFYSGSEWLAVVIMHRLLIVAYLNNKKNVSDHETTVFHFFASPSSPHPPSLRAEVIAG